MARKFIVALGAGGLILASIWLAEKSGTVPAVNAEKGGVNGLAAVSKPAVPAPASARGAAPPVRCTSAAPALAGEAPLRISLGESAEVDDLFSSAYRSPDRLLSKWQQGEPAATLALFKLLRNCFGIEKWEQQQAAGESVVKPILPSCPSLGREIVKNPLNILEVAAERGSADAKLWFAQNSATFALVYTRENSQASVLEARRISLLAEKYGEAAARAGIREAFLFMTRAYETGLFGTRDAQLAYTYLLPLEKGDKNPASTAHLEKLKLSLNDRQQREAHDSAFGCAAGNRADSLKNPFDDAR